MVALHFSSWGERRRGRSRINVLTVLASCGPVDGRLSRPWPRAGGGQPSERIRRPATPTVGADRFELSASRSRTARAKPDCATPRCATLVHTKPTFRLERKTCFLPRSCSTTELCGQERRRRVTIPRSGFCRPMPYHLATSPRAGRCQEPTEGFEPSTRDLRSRRSTT